MLNLKQTKHQLLISTQNWFGPQTRMKMEIVVNYVLKFGKAKYEPTLIIQDKMVVIVVIIIIKSST